MQLINAFSLLLYNVRQTKKENVLLEQSSKEKLKPFIYQN